MRTSPSEPREPALLNILPPAPSGELYQLTVTEKNFTCFFQNLSCCKFISSSFEINLLSTAHLCIPAPNHTHIKKVNHFPRGQISSLNEMSSLSEFNLECTQHRVPIPGSCPLTPTCALWHGHMDIGTTREHKQTHTQCRKK